MRSKRHLKIDTFPFLAVLLGAMGALILVLLVFDRRAKIVARAKAMEAMARVQTEEENRLATLRTEWERRRQELHARLESEDAEVRGRLQTTLAQIEAGLAGLRSEEERERQLQAQLQAERAALARLEQELISGRTRGAQTDSQTALTSAEAARLLAEVTQLERTLEEVKTAARQARETYSVVPYRGKRGDSRRPIYVECAATGVIFHPDRLALTGPDFSRADVRSEVEKRIGKPPAAGSDGRAEETAYLLLLVRPEGVITYYYAMESLKGLPIAFGYELIDTDWALDFPKEGDAPGQPWMAGARTPAALAAPVPRGMGQGRPRGVTFGPGLVGPDEAGARPGRLGGFGTMSRVGGLEELPLGWGGSASATPYLAPGGGTRRGGAGPERGTAPSATTGAANTGQGTTAAGGGVPGNGQDTGPISPVPATTGDTARAGPPSAAGAMSGSQGVGGGAPAAQPGSPSGTHAGEHESGRSGGAGAADSPSPEAGSSFRLLANAEARSGLGGAAGATPQSATDDGAARGRCTAATAEQGPRGSGSANGGTGAAASGSAGAEACADAGTSARMDVPPSTRGPGAAQGSPATPGQTAPAERGAKPAARPVRFSSTRDWTILVECTAGAVVLYPGQVRFPTTSLTPARGNDNPLVQAVQQMAARRQTAVRPGELPYRVQVRFLVRPDGLRAFHTAYPLLGTLGLPMTRQDIDRTEEVRGP